MSETEPSLEEILAALNVAVADVPEGYYSSEEWAERLSLTGNAVHRLLVKACRRGFLLTQRRRGVGIDGRATYTPVYALRLPARN